MKRQKRFFIRDPEGILIVYQDYFDTITSRTQALALGLLTYKEMTYNLVREGLQDKGPLYIRNMKVQTGLQRTLDELNVRFPFLNKEIEYLTKSNVC